MAYNARMPFHWVRISSSPPKKRRNEVAEICRRHNAKLCENQIFYDDDNVHALIQTPDDPAQVQALLADPELGALEWLGKVDADEKEAGKRPPHSGRRP